MFFYLETAPDTISEIHEKFAAVGLRSVVQGPRSEFHRSKGW